MFSHGSGKWAQRIKGRLHYFGTWNDTWGALEEFEQRYPELASRVPSIPSRPASSNGKMTFPTDRGHQVSVLRFHDSQGWYDVFCTLSGRETFGDAARDEILPELGTEGVVDSITFIWRFLLHPEARSSCAKAVVSDIVRYVGNDSILTTWHNMLELPDSELVDMGFSNVGGTELIFNDLHFQTPCDTRHPLGEEIGFEARPKHEEWVLKKWGK